MSLARDVLVIDDERVVIDAALKICAAEGLSAEAASRGKKGLELLGVRRYGLVLCDIMMEDLDGFGILSALEKTENAPPVVMITGFSTVEHAVRSLDLGAADFLAKPFTADELAAVVKRGLRYGELRKDPLSSVSGPAGYHRLGRLSWAALEPSGTALIGACDMFTKTLSGIRGVELLQAGDELVQGSAAAVIEETGGSRHGLLAPMGGKVLEANREVLASPVLIEKDPYFGGWLYRILPASPESEMDHLTPCSSDRQ